MGAPWILDSVGGRQGAAGKGQGRYRFWISDSRISMEKNWNYKGGFCKITFVQLPDIFFWTE
jgi:hypothetical protein